MKINELLLKDNVKIDAFYYCPYHPNFNSEEECKCRKPSPELVFKAAKDFSVDLDKSYFVGDAVSDIECGMNAGVKTLLVKTGYGLESLSILQNKFASFVAENISDACNIIINDYSGE
jgi:histidinol-phosphate phosphatase family protein